ncbi:addiction module protein [Verrucomicrobium sp. BvORR106]|uniref:addiction module protein n=1 Tax=Verrucomicrobium sp. BvORR106 TaxID=1403819 RepID=UPI00056EE04F|nr:addiction module protein [Verrucomicrobium sp. BvORR106]
MNAATIEKEALQLTEVERAVLADRLIESLDHTPSELKKSWADEANSRLDAFQKGEILALDGPKTLNALKSRFQK